jgi:hypothetical protein
LHLAFQVQIGSNRVICAAAAVASVPLVEGKEYTDRTDEERAALAAKLGYTTIGKTLPDGITLADIVRTMPPEVSRRHRILCATDTPAISCASHPILPLSSPIASHRHSTSFSKGPVH